MKISTGLLGAEYGTKAKNILSERFLIPPFTVLNAREGFWQERKRKWVSIGIQSELGRGENLLKMSDTVLEPDPIKRAALKAKKANASPFNRGVHGQDPMNIRDKFAKRKSLIRKKPDEEQPPPEPDDDAPNGGTSIFDPVLCELIYRWFVPEGGSVLDPFAGGSVRGIMASALGLHYTGVDLSARQIKANREQAAEIKDLTHKPNWICGDSLDVRKLANGEFDLVFSCPPYGDLERYSDDPRDLSTLAVAEFRSKYAAIISNACEMLGDSGFACFVVGDYRDKRGFYTNLPGETINAFERCGMHLYNHAILVVSTGSLPLRVQAGFVGSRKLGNTHQHVLIFAKGEPSKFVRAWSNSNLGF